MTSYLHSDLKILSGKTALVTGGTGMIGREAVKILCKAGARVRVVSLDKIKLEEPVEQIHGDLCDFNFCKKITKDIDYVFHIAGIKGSIVVTKEKPASFFVPLLMMNTNLLEAARLAEIKGLVYTSSIGVYPSAEVFIEENYDLTQAPMDLFPGWAKRIAEMQIEAYMVQYGLKNFSIVRPSNVYGPGDNFDPENAMVIPSLMARIHKGENPVVIWGDGSAIRDFVFSRDVALGIILACIKGTHGKAVNLGGIKGYTIKELVETLHKVTPFTYEFDSSKPKGFPKRIMDNSHSRATIGYEPSVSLEDGLRETWEWFIDHAEEYKKRLNYFTK